MRLYSPVRLERSALGMPVGRTMIRLILALIHYWRIAHGAARWV